MSKLASLPFFTGALALALSLAAAGCAIPQQEQDPEEVGAAESALTIAGLFSTGVDATGTPLAVGAVDPHYTLASTDPAFPGPSAIAVTPASGWTANTTTSKWISIQANDNGVANAKYTYTTTFTLGGVNPLTATLAGKWACDDSCVLKLNGTQVAATTASAWTTVTSFAVPAGSPFVIGVNTLSFVATNTTGGATGVQVVTLTGTVAGCALDTQCSATQFCNTQTAACTAKLTNGTPIPTISGHTPALGGTCTPANGGAVCVAGVCDTKDNDCGLAVGDGPCTAADGALVCRSGACSVDGLCEPAGGCNADGDCAAAGKWCNESTHTCTAKLVNGSMLPSDPPHDGPMLDGTCTIGAAALVCASGVCDVDNLCGYADGDGPCAAANNGAECRSGMCSIDGLCEPAGGCNADGDCASGNWCDESTHTCTPQLANGNPLPVDAPHAAPTLDGTCSIAAGTLVCVSGVCDTDDLCGYAYGDGPCTTDSGPIVCRVGVCSPNALVCIPAGGCAVDADCAADSYCNTPAFTCVPKEANGQPVPTVAGHTPDLSGTCTAQAGAVVCTSGVCDTKDNDCGYANGDGPCTDADGATVCRSGTCATSGPNLGTCVGCTADAQCPSATPVCDPTTNTCVDSGGCHVDADCAASQWCNAPAGGSGTCTAKLADGTPLPTMPVSVATCSASVGARVCQSGVCDPASDRCGSAACTKDSDCPSGDYCRSDGTCVTKVSEGGACDGSNQCVDGDCQDEVCQGLIASGNGLFCAAARVGAGSQGEGGAFGLVGLMLAAAGLARRRR